MSTQVAVPVGSSATLIASGFSGLVINTDSKNAVWLSSSPSVQAGQGVPLQPLGSANWNQGGPIYGVVAAGVTSPVTLNLSTESTNVDNPVAVGSAVAAQLLSQGVPSVLTGALITGVANNTPVDVSGYASVSGTIDVPTPGYLLVQFFDPTSTVLLFQDVFTFSGAMTGWVFSTPVHGPRLKLVYNGSGGSGGALNISLYGSNRDLPVSSYAQNTITTTISGSFTAGQVYPAAAGVPTRGGNASLFVQCGSTIVGSFGYQYWDLWSHALPGALTYQRFIDSKALASDSDANISANVQNWRVPPGVIVPAFRAGANCSGTVIISGTLP